VSLRQIPVGATLTYEELAADAGRPGAQRAAGTANGANRIAVLIPCHRVIRKSGEVGGYGGGSWRKAWLLDHERRLAAGDQMRMSVPIA
jgi:O-6-methylguanine DNA methyltransferase